MKRFTLILSLLVAMVTTAMAQIDLVDGGIYKIMNIAYPTKCIYDGNVTSAKAGVFNANSANHYWVVVANEDGTFLLKNLSSNKYLNGGEKAGSKHWQMGAEETKLYIYKHSEGKYYISYTQLSDIAEQSQTCAHNPSDHDNLVTWNNVEGGTQLNPSTWNFVLVSSLSILESKTNEAKTFLAEKGFAVNVGEAVALSVGEGGNLTTNFPAIDGDVLDNCIDSQSSTLFHSDWMADGSVKHYLQVDLGEGNELEAFELNYVTRQSGNNAAPYTAVVYGSNDAENFTAIAELSKNDFYNPLPRTNGPSYSATLVADKPYRYIRFTVLTSPNSNGSFGLAEFEIKKATVTKGTDADRFRAYNFLNTISNESNAAKFLFLVEALTGALQEYPITISTNTDEPVCYAIKSARSDAWNDGDYYWTFTPGNGGAITIFPYVTIDSEDYKKDIYKYWFFQENKEGHLQMIPAADRNNPMGYLTVQNGHSKMRNDASVSGFAGNTYKLVDNSSSYNTYPYALQPYGTDNYVSNFGGKDGHPMGFWNGDGFGDTGGRFEFVELETPSKELETLSASIVAARTYKAGTEVGEFTEAAIENLKTILDAATVVLADATSSDEQCLTHISAIEEAVKTLAINLPVESKFYTITNQGADRTGMTALTVEANGGLRGVAATAMDGVFQFVKANNNTFYLYSVERGTYLSTATLSGDDAQNYALATEISEAKTVTLSSLANGVVGITPNGGHMLHVAGGSKVVGWNETAATKASAWVIEEVEDITALSHDVTIGEAGYATLHLNYAVTIPEGVEAYAVSEINEGYVSMTAVTGAIPANEAVILKKAEGQPIDATPYKFNYAESATDVETNLLEGTTIDTYIAGPAYVLGYINVAEEGQEERKEVGLYKTILNRDENGNATGTTHFKNNANKAYLVVPGASEVASYSFRFGEGTTGINEITDNRVQSTVIYDLTGRRVENISAPGIYIVNGVKKLVR